MEFLGGHHSNNRNASTKENTPFGVAQSPDPKVLWPGVRSVKHGSPEKMNEPKQFCKEEWSG